MKRNGLVFAALCIAILLMVASGRFLRRAVKTGGSPLVGDVRGKTAPDFELVSLDGKKVKLSDYRGKAVLLNFWATWCSPCKVEMPWLVDFQKKYGSDGLVVLGVAMDDTETPKISEFAHEMGVNYPILLGTDKVSEEYGNVQYLPTSFYIDRDGKFVGKGVGMLERKEFEVNIQKALSSRHAGINTPPDASAGARSASPQSTAQ